MKGWLWQTAELQAAGQVTGMIIELFIHSRGWACFADKALCTGSVFCSVGHKTTSCGAGRKSLHPPSPTSDATLPGVQARFAKHVFPGEALLVHMWRVGPDRVVFTTEVKDRPGTLAVTAAAVELQPSAKL